MSLEGAVGLIVPSNNQILETELDGLRNHGIGVVVEHVPVEGTTAGHVHAMAEHSRAAILRLAQAGVEGLLYACMWTSLVTPATWEGDLARFAHAEVSLPLETAASALWRALRRHDARRTAVLTAYPGPVHHQMCALVREHGYEVTANGTLDLQSLDDIGSLRPSEVLRLAERVLAGPADVVCVLGTDVPTAEIVEPLQRLSGVPVVTSNQALAAVAVEMLTPTGDPVQ